MLLRQQLQVMQCVLAKGESAADMPLQLALMVELFQRPHAYASGAVQQVVDSFAALVRKNKSKLSRLGNAPILPIQQRRATQSEVLGIRKQAEDHQTFQAWEPAQMPCGYTDRRVHIDVREASRQ